MHSIVASDHRKQAEISRGFTSDLDNRRKMDFNGAIISTADRARASKDNSRQTNFVNALCATVNPKGQ